MRYLKKLFLSLSMALLLTVSLNMFQPLNVHATTNGKTQSDAVNWVCARGDEAWCVDVDGVYGCQCVDLIMAYYDYLLGYHVSGNAIDYSSNTLPSGWTRVYSNPQPGDVVVWKKGAALGWYPLNTEYANSTYGHIGIVWRVNDSGTISTIETNTLSGQAAAYKERYTDNIACYIRPDFASGVRTDYMNLGDSFDALIIRADIWKPIRVDSYNNVVLGTEAGRAYFHWHFERQSNGAYVITSMYNGKVLDVADAGTTNGTNVQVYNRWGGADNKAQQWYIYGNAVAFELAPANAMNLRLDVYNAETADNTNVILWQANGGANQIFSIYKFDKKVPTEMEITGSSSVEVGKKIKLGLDFKGATDYTTATWSSADSKIAKVDSSGNVTGVSKGGVLISATSVYNDRIVASKLVTVTEPQSTAHTHQYTHTVTKQPTCSEKGIRTYVCVCGHSYTEEIAMTAHGSAVIKNKKAATEKAAGYTGDSCCSICGKVLKAGTTTEKAGTVLRVASEKYVVAPGEACIEYRACIKGASTVNIPATVKVGGVTYKVTGIAKNAFKKNKSLKIITIGVNVKKIGAYAFYGCKNLKTIVVKTGYLEKGSIGKKAFSGINAKATIKVPKSKYTYYKRTVFKGKIGKKVKIKK
ncbi:MAG: RICIN domain-containing protein [Lachnospiraceae bacterium]